MEIKENSKIRYTIKIEPDEIYTLDLTIEQIEGSVPNFVEQVHKALDLNKNEKIEILKREIL